ncbi:sigma-54 dependent transcriptional regulator, partial [Myxococcota bacterium]|nr:sigma-54 dependent transcriptional regulator [Myxococcota bacterium]MBU1536258.1 sigma-54 dependent transcriptional regulator [Myxococcota bacterium]
AFDYIEKPFDKDQLLSTLARALASYDAGGSASSLLADTPYAGRHGMIGRSDAMEHVFKLIDRIADTSSTILLSGESGTGKELVAKAIHATSGRSHKPFIRVNCAAIPENLLESEFFGHEEGAFTGALHAKPGRFELAQGGTILLDEVGELPFPMQAKLLRVLQENEYERVGGIVTLKSDARVIASTNKDLKAETQAGAFREDLFYRLNVVPIELPPLRERPSDIPLLIEYFMSNFNSGNQTDYSISPVAMDLLCTYSWPGNIRELENALERTFLLSEPGEILPSNLPPEICESEAGIPERKMELSDSGLKEVVRRETSRIEKDLIHQALDSTGGNVTKAAQILRISRKGLQNKIRELHIREDLLTEEDL